MTGDLQIWVYRAGALPLHPAKELFEKSSLESQKLSKRLSDNVFESFRKSRNPFSKGFLVGVEGATPPR